MAQEKPEAKNGPHDKTSTGYVIPVRPRDETLAAFRKIARPLPEKAPKKD
jgi:hypothetical protein